MCTRCGCNTYPFGAASASCASAPDHVVGLYLVENALGLRFALDIFNTADQNVQSTLLALAELLDGRDLLLSTDNAGDGPRLPQQDGRQNLRDLAVAAEDEDVLTHDVKLVVVASGGGENRVGESNKGT